MRRSPKRAVTASGRQVRVPAGSAVMSSGSRRNPDLTGPLGTFGWDVLPGYDTITARRSRCRSPTGGRTARSALHAVLPAVDDLVLILRCPCLSRRVTRMRLSVLREKYSAFGLTARLTARGSPRPFLGVTIKLGSRTLAMMAPEPRTGIVIVDGDGLRRGRNTVSATYSGDAALDPAATRLQLTAGIETGSRPECRLLGFVSGIAGGEQTSHVPRAGSGYAASRFASSAHAAHRSWRSLPSRRPSRSCDCLGDKAVARWF